MWGWDPVQDANDYAELVEEWDEEEMDKELTTLKEETSLYWEFLKELLEREGVELEVVEVDKKVEGGEGDKEVEQLE